MSNVIIPFIKGVYSVSEYIIINNNNILFYTLEEDGLIEY